MRYTTAVLPISLSTSLRIWLQRQIFLKIEYIFKYSLFFIWSDDLTMA